MTEQGRAHPLAREFPTPDYYSYPWSALAEARLTANGTARLTWPDGTTLECHPMWLRENAPGPGGIDPVTRECELDPAHLNPDLSIGRMSVAGGALEVTFEPEHRNASYHPGWLRHIAEQTHRPFAVIPEPLRWTTAEDQPTEDEARAGSRRPAGGGNRCRGDSAFGVVDRVAMLREPPTHDGRSVLRDDDSLAAGLCDLARYGLIRLAGCGTGPDTVAQMARLIGAMRDSNFGQTWHVDVDITPISLANTGQRLAPHTDLPTREVPPGLQLLHCVENSVEGGWSTMADGLAVAEHLRAHEPDAFEALTTLEWVFFNRSPEHDHRWQGPVIDTGDGRIPYTYRAFHPVRAFPAMAVDDMDRAYAAMRILSATAGSDQFQLRYPFRPGDIVVFDNRRVLHGRDGFEPHAGTRRRLIGSYMDTDEFYSRLRVLLRRGAALRTGPAGADALRTGQAGAEERIPADA